MKVETYLFFNGRCEEALEFYQKALGAKIVNKMRFSDSPDKSQCAPGTLDKIMHATFSIGETQLMASDGRCEGQPKFEGMSLTIGVKSPEEAEKLFKAIGEGGQVQVPMMETFFATRWGMVADKFGVSWMVLSEKQHGPS
jgi:PhnB protein